ncbi:MAG: hypothetical protein AAF598_08120 [Bacteroidota bacterium]
MRQLLLLLFIVITFSCSQEEIPIPNDPPAESTGIAKGIFGLRDAAALSNLGAEYTRILAWDSDLKVVYEQVDNGVPLENNPYYQQIRNIHEAGVHIIFTLRWPDQSSSDPALYDRVPLGQDRQEALDLLSRFLNDFGPMIRIYALQNEVGGLGPGTYVESDMQQGPSGSPAVQWWTALTERYQFEKANNSELTHLQISSPVPVLLKRLVFDPSGLPATNVDFFYETVEFGNAHCDYIDFHFNTFTLEEHEEALNFLQPLVNKPMIATEWSEVGSSNAYINQAISDAIKAYAATINYNIPASISTNDELIEHLYDHPSNLEFWSLLVEESRYSENFMKASSTLLAEANFKIVCWNSGWQEGLTAYDLRSFFATKTVQGPNNEMIPFTQEFKDL